MCKGLADKSLRMKILIIEARFYPEIADPMLAGAKKVLDAAGAEYELLSVSGALEIPAVISMARDSFDGFVALGCVIRGETYHFDIVSNESARGINDLAMQHKLAIGNGIITVENRAQAIVRAGEMDKGGFAANACLEMIKIKEKFKGNNGR